MEVTYEDVREILAGRNARKRKKELLQELEGLWNWVLERRERDMAEYRRILRELRRTRRGIEAGGG